MGIKTELYPKVKLMLSKAASSYGKGGFENVADWVLATSIYFDAAWHLIKADQASDLNEKGRLLGIGSNYLKSALELFGKAGYKVKEAEVQDRLNRVEKEESILFSALSTIKEPSISRSTMGIVAPPCPLESSQSPRLSEARQLIEEERRVAEESEWKSSIQYLYIILKSGLTIYTHDLSELQQNKQFIDEDYLGGALSAIDSLLKEIASNKEPLKVIKQERFRILLEEGEKVYVAVIALKEFRIIRRKMKEFLKEFQEFFKEFLEKGVSDAEAFNPAKILVSKHFG